MRDNESMLGFFVSIVAGVAMAALIAAAVLLLMSLGACGALAPERTPKLHCAVPPRVVGEMVRLTCQERPSADEVNCLYMGYIDGMPGLCIVLLESKFCGDWAVFDRTCGIDYGDLGVAPPSEPVNPDAPQVRSL